MVNILFVYRTGGEYDADDVANMRWQIAQNVTVAHNVICLSDDPEYADVLLETKLDKWWGKLELFNFINTPCLYLDLDVVILRNLDALINTINELRGVYMMPSCTPRVEALGDRSSSIMAWNGDFSYIPAEFDESTMRSWRNDQTYITEKFKEKSQHIKDVRELVSVCGWNSCARYGIPKGTRLINFYGDPRPRHLGLPYWGGHLTNKD